MVHAKHYETMSTIVKVMQKKLWPLFFPDTVYILAAAELSHAKKVLLHRCLAWTKAAFTLTRVHVQLLV